MKIFLLTILLLADSKSCEQSLKVLLIKATSQQWSGGAAGAGRGVYYKIYLGKINQADFVFDSLWVDGKRLAVTSNPGIGTNDTLVLNSTDVTGIIRRPPDANGVSQTEVIRIIPFPVETTGEGLLGYLYKDERKYLVINSWVRLAPIFYP